MKKRLSEKQFQRVIKNLEVGKQTIKIAYGVLVNGQSQVSFVKSLELTKGAVSQAVNRIWEAHLEYDGFPGYEKVSVLLPKQRAFIVKKWAKEAEKKIK